MHEAKDIVRVLVDHGIPQKRAVPEHAARGPNVQATVDEGDLSAGAHDLVERAIPAPKTSVTIFCCLVRACRFVQPCPRTPRR